MQTISLFADPRQSLNRLYSLLEGIDPIPYDFSRITLEITLYCEIGCAHCKYSPPPPPEPGRKRPDMFLSGDGLAEFVDFTWRVKLPSLCITGGGEPTHEWENVKYLIREVYCPEIMLYTAAQWATDPAQTARHIDELEQTLAQRRVPARLLLRLSADRYHQVHVPITYLANVVSYVRSRQLGDPQYPIWVKLRSLLSDDPTVEELASLLSAELRFIAADKAKLILPDGYELEALYVALSFTGRLKKEANRRDKTFMPFEDFLQVASLTYGPTWPLIYAGGLNIGVRPNGDIYLYGSNPRKFGSIYSEKLEDVSRRMCCDPITRAAIRGSWLEVWRLAKFANPKLAKIPSVYNGPELLLPVSLRSPQDQLFTTLALLGRELVNGSISGPRLGQLRSYIGYDPSTTSDAWDQAVLHDYNQAKG